MADAAVAAGAELEFWSSDSWIDIWAGIPLHAPPPASAAGLVRAALLPSSNVNFPQITEICERVAAEPPEAAEAVGLLVYALRDNYAPYRKKLKALTISNEMMYDELARSTFRTVDGLQEVLGVLRSVRNSGLGSAMDDNIRMLATEIEKNCFSEGGAPQRSGLRGFGSALMGNLGLRRERSDPVVASQGGAQPDSGAASAPVENTFYFDDKVQRWRQKGVPDEFDAVPSAAATVNGSTSSGNDGTAATAAPPKGQLDPAVPPSAAATGVGPPPTPATAVGPPTAFTFPAPAFQPAAAVANGPLPTPVTAVGPPTAFSSPAPASQPAAEVAVGPPPTQATAVGPPTAFPPAAAAVVGPPPPSAMAFSSPAPSAMAFSSTAPAFSSPGPTEAQPNFVAPPPAATAASAAVPPAVAAAFDLPQATEAFPPDLAASFGFSPGGSTFLGGTSAPPAMNDEGASKGLESLFA